jgi:hypothetical protein
MLIINRLLWIGLLCAGITAATIAQAGNQMFDGSWSIKAFGNECFASDPSPGPHCAGTTGESRVYSGFGMPQNIQCNPDQPRCPFDSTPSGGNGSFAPLGGSRDQALFCVPWFNWQGNGATARPAKGETVRATTKNEKPIPPLYRNPAFFTPNGQRGNNLCTGTSSGATPDGRGLVQIGQPVTGRWAVTTTGTQRGGFNFASAPSGPPAGKSSGFRATGLVGEFGAIYPYVYSYTYATLRNDVGFFGPGSGPGAFNLLMKQGAATVASINVKQGAAKFGGTMRMLGALTAKVCYYRQGGCSLGENNWRYEAVGTSAVLSKGGAITGGYLATYKAYYYHTGLMQVSTVQVEGSRFPWTTGSVTLTAVGRGPHKTIHYTQGFDNRNTTTPEGQGTIQLVTPVLTRWMQPALNFETGGVGILRIKFVPEPQMWAMLIAGVSLLGAGYRMRGR